MLIKAPKIEKGWNSEKIQMKKFEDIFQEAIEDIWKAYLVYLKKVVNYVYFLSEIRTYYYYY